MLVPNDIPYAAPIVSPVVCMSLISSLFEIVAVVTKHGGEGGHSGRVRGKKGKEQDPDMQQVCEQHGLPQFSPHKASAPEFLDKVSKVSAPE